jgi:uncharacterized protein YqeY
MNESQLQSLQRVLSYLEDEQNHFEATSIDERANHIYTDILVLEEYLKQNLKPGDVHP